MSRALQTEVLGRRCWHERSIEILGAILDLIEQINDILAGNLITL